MKQNTSITIILCCFFLIFNSCIQSQEIDICIYGGTSAGVIAAYTAKKEGKSVLLIEPGRRLGGLSSGGLGLTDIGNKYAITGLARDFYRRVGAHYGKLEQWTFEPKVAEMIFLDYIKRGNVDVLYDSRLVSVKKEDRRITEIMLENSVNPSTETNKVIKAKMFIDCSYEGDLMAKAGVSYTVGREDNSEYNETWNGMFLAGFRDPSGFHQFPDGVDPYKIPGKPESGLLWGISDATIEPDGTGDKRVQAYNFRICLTDDPKNLIPITEPDNYDPERYELLVRAFKAQPDDWQLSQYFIWALMPNRKTDINNRGAFSTDMIGMNYGYTEGSYEERKRIVKEHEDYTKGLLYFYQTDPRVPKRFQEEVLKWGYPKDEYVEYGHWSPQLYIREARRMIGAYVMTQHNCEGREVVEDRIGMAAYGMDSHNCQRLVVNGQVKNEGNVEVGGFSPYPVAYRSITPKPEDCTNLLVPVCLSSTHIAFGSIRMEPVFMVLGQSAAVAASMSIDSRTDVQRIDVAKLQKELKENPLADHSFFEILVDNEEKANIELTGDWDLIKGRGAYGPTMFLSKGEGAVKFIPEIAKKGAYDIYTYVPRLAGNNIPLQVTINDGKNVVNKTIIPSEVIVIGQTTGEWVSLGSYELSEGKNAFVSIASGGNKGVPADALILVPTK